MARLPFLFAVLVLAGCAAHEPPMARGPWRQLNPDKWAFSESALSQPPPGLGR